MVNTVGIIDYGCGNLRSVVNAFQHIGADCEVVENPNGLVYYSHLVLPGVGSYRKAMQYLKQNQFDSKIKELVSNGTPLLGICLGMQLLGSRSSEDGETEGLGFIEADVDLLVISKEDMNLKVPHVGFNTVHIDARSTLFNGFEDRADFYFTHSYRMSCKNSLHAIGITTHGDTFASAVENQNVLGTQFHPEKSQRNGLKILSNFMSFKPC